MDTGSLIFIIPAATIIGAAIIIKAILDNWHKFKNSPPMSMDGDPTNRSGRHYSRTMIANLKWGFILAGLGLALVFREFLLPTLSEAGTFGFMFVFAGLGFFIYYFIARQSIKKDEYEKSDEKKGK